MVLLKVLMISRVHSHSLAREEMEITKNSYRTALVTGATGFIGINLVQRLIERGWEVHILARYNSTLPHSGVFAKIIRHTYDATTDSIYESLVHSKPNIVFHLASKFKAEHITEDIGELVASNILFGTQLLEAMRISNSNVKIINTGTAWQHFNNEEYNPMSLYAATKQSFEAILEYYCDAHNFKAITLKLSDTYGPKDSRKKLVPLLEKADYNNERLRLSGGEQYIDLIYITDVIDGYLIAAERLMSNEIKGHEKYSLTSGAPIKVRQLVETYFRVIGRKLTVEWGAMPYRMREMMAPWKSNSVLENWSPKVSLESGLRKVREFNKKT